MASARDRTRGERLEGGHGDRRPHGVHTHRRRRRSADDRDDARSCTAHCAGGRPKATS